MKVFLIAKLIYSTFLLSVLSLRNCSFLTFPHVILVSTILFALFLSFITNMFAIVLLSAYVLLLKKSETKRLNYIFKFVYIYFLIYQILLKPLYDYHCSPVVMTSPYFCREQICDAIFATTL